MGVAERRQREKQALRAGILAAASDLFVEHGYESVSMRKIAQRIDHSPTAIYLHFKDKSELLQSICDETFLKLSAVLHSIVERMEAGDCDVIDGLEEGLHAYVEFGLSHPNHYQLTLLKQREYSNAEDMSSGFQAFSYLTRAVGACMRAGRIRGKHVDEISQALWAGIHGVTALLIQHSQFPFVARKKLIRRVIGSMVDGLRK